jgi:hypothetical protein
MQRESRRRQHIVRREDGSILIINYEDFNQLISQPLSSIVTSSGGSTGSNQPSSAVESSQESSISEKERSLQRQRSLAGGSSSSQSEDSSHNGYAPGSSDQATSFSDSAMSSVHKDPNCSSGEEADLLLTPSKSPGQSGPNTVHMRTESRPSTVRLDTSHMKTPTDQTFEQLINGLNHNETANLTAALATILPESARDSIQVQIIDKGEAQREWEMFHGNREGMVQTFGCCPSTGISKLRRL